MQKQPSKSLLPRAPNDSHRHVIIGRSGTGKSVAEIFALSGRSYDEMPWIIVDYKLDAYISRLRATKISAYGALPTEPGLYHCTPDPIKGSLDELLTRAWHQENVGLCIDETADVGMHSDALTRVCKQGRSKNVPLIACTQRPSWINPNVFSEASFIQVFPLTFKQDKQKVTEWMPVDVNYAETLEEYQSLYFDVDKNRLCILEPVPYGPKVLEIFERRKPRPIKRFGSRR